ncbi:MAG: U32 family peptidase [bacterium]
MKNKIELSSPAGSWETLSAAIKAGADSIYFGVSHLNMRSHSSVNFTLDDLNKIVRKCKKHRAKTYLTLNTVLYNEDLNLAKTICDAAKKAGISAVICFDMAVIRFAHSIGLQVHISTQANISNIESVKYFSSFADAIILARELSLEQISSICSSIKNENILGPSGKPVKIEVFVHGALCVSIAGKCYMSLATQNASANRGKCFQPCRRAYKVIDKETEQELVVDNQYVMSPKDLCTIGIIDKLINSGISIFKIEGRARSPEYVYTATECYKEAIQSSINGTFSKRKIDLWKNKLHSVYNRGFWENGYYLGKKLGEWTSHPGSLSTCRKTFSGIAVKYFPRAKIAEILLQSGGLKINDNILATGPTTGLVKAKIKSICVNDTPVKKASKGDRITIPIPDKIRRNDKIYVLTAR